MYVEREGETQSNRSKGSTSASREPASQPVLFSSFLAYTHKPERTARTYTAFTRMNERSRKRVSEKETKAYGRAAQQIENIVSRSLKLSEPDRSNVVVRNGTKEVERGEQGDVAGRLPANFQLFGLLASAWPLLCSFGAAPTTIRPPCPKQPFWCQNRGEARTREEIAKTRVLDQCEPGSRSRLPPTFYRARHASRFTFFSSGETVLSVLCVPCEQRAASTATQTKARRALLLISV